ncbi:hypothetical protein V1291_005566 [Nitrobacteraceae bacterium AZCC 1564]
MPCMGVGLGTEAEPKIRTASLTPDLDTQTPDFDTSVVRQTRHAHAPRMSETEAGVSLSGLVSPLAAKLASIQAACPGTHAISGVRHTRIAGTRRMSLHAQGKAVDVRGPYGCIYTELKGWTGGYSTDAGRVRHIHISYDEAGGREMGLRFAHGGGRRHHRHAFRSAYARMR